LGTSTLSIIIHLLQENNYHEPLTEAGKDDKLLLFI